MPHGLEENTIDILSPHFKQLETIQGTLQTSLRVYLSRIQHHLQTISQIHVAVLAQNEVLDPKFDASIVEVQRSYSKIVSDMLKNNISAAKKVQNVGGIFGFIVEFLEMIISAFQKISTLEHQVFTNLTSREEHAPLMQREILQRQYKEIEEQERAIDDIFLIEQKKIIVSASDEQELIRNVHTDMLLYIDKVKNIIKNSLNGISERIKNLPLNETRLSRQLMSIYLMRGTSSASALSGVSALKTRIAHYARKIHARIAYSTDLSAIQALGSLKKPNRLEMKCLTAIPKRYSEQDFDANNYEYYEMLKEMRMVIFIIRKNGPRTLGENVNLLKSFLLCEVDKLAIHMPLLKPQLSKQNRFFVESSDIHLVIKDQFISLWRYASDATEDTIKEQYIDKIKNKSLDIVLFYVDQLIKGFITHPVFKVWVDQKTEADKKELLKLVVRIINNELADKSPSNYFKAPLCGLSLFCGVLGDHGAIKLELNEDGKMTLNFTGSLSVSGEIEKQHVKYTLLDTSEPALPVRPDIQP